MRHAAEIFVRRESDGNYLVLRSSNWQERPDRSHKLDLPGGFVEDGEAPLDGAVRELREETGIDANSEALKFLRTDSVDMVGVGPLQLHFYLLTVGDSAITLSWEHEAYYWYSAAELKSMEIRRPFSAIIAELFEDGTLS